MVIPFYTLFYGMSILMLVGQKIYIMLIPRHGSFHRNRQFLPPMGGIGDSMLLGIVFNSIFSSFPSFI